MVQGWVACQLVPLGPAASTGRWTRVQPVEPVGASTTAREVGDRMAGLPEVAAVGAPTWL
ncbi:MULTISPECIES: hypothetical protein [unclassified Streptomyces]|uniref:hypothetical protein n=1 Tax=unclassified Streptomyces TaxID=2593676 RepID=UPI00225B8077|nr:MULTISPECIES: hypothetical protein [unclassified Streptomyces]MCX4632403.1 hypothetical protein [Streptomyces sp. NBC_01443]WSW49479.1 hypothetical protein OG296_40670 [Streptomyces sp. NBC_01001]